MREDGMTETGRWTDAFLQTQRAVGDPLADQVIRSIFAAGEVGTINSLMRSMVQNEALIPERMPPLVRDYLTVSERLPDWADPAKIQLAEEVFCEFGPHIVTILLCASLPECYACGKGAEILNLSGILSSHAKRRVLETAQFVMDVMSPGGLSPHGDGIRTTQKVRLMHAAIRHLALTSPAANPEWGTPVNQEDLAGTLMTFSIVVIDGLTRMNIPLTPAKAEAYLHAWKCVGHILGLQAEMLPENLPDARNLMAGIRRHQSLRTDAGIALMTALVEFLADLIPNHSLDGLIHALIWHLSGDQVAALLEVPSPNWERILLGPLRFADALTLHLDHRIALVEKIAERVNLDLMEGFVFVERGGTRPPFRIPETLCTRWHLSAEAQERTLSGQSP